MDIQLVSEETYTSTPWQEEDLASLLEGGGSDPSRRYAGSANWSEMGKQAVTKLPQGCGSLSVMRNDWR